MNWQQFQIDDSDNKAKNHILRALSVGARDHTLSRTLRARFSNATGPIELIAFDLLDVNGINDYEFAASYRGEGLADALKGQTLSQGEYPLDGLILFLGEHLGSSKESVVLCENLFDTRTVYLTNWRPRESRVLFYREEVYHILTSDEHDVQSVETAIRESSLPWAIGVCSFCDALPQGETTSDAFFDGIAAKTTTIFTAVLDDGGYLLWSPARSD